MEKMNNNRARSLRQVRSSRSRSKRGVSPVIGVILMVAATIVIAGVVMGMLGGSIRQKRHTLCRYQVQKLYWRDNTDLYRRT